MTRFKYIFHKPAFAARVLSGYSGRTMKGIKGDNAENKGGEYALAPLGEGGSLRVPVRRSARARRVRLSVSPRGEARITVPLGVSLEIVNKLVSGYGAWLAKTLERARPAAERPFPPPRTVLPPVGINAPLRDGGDFNRGRVRAASAREVYINDPGVNRAMACWLDEGVILFGCEDKNARAAALRGLFWKMGKKLLPPLVEKIGASFGLPAATIKIRDQRGRWGGCSRSSPGAVAVINLNWRSLLLPVNLFAHLCLHEYAHGLQMNHSPAFYAILAQRNASWREDEKGLNEAWRAMPPWLFA